MRMILAIFVTFVSCAVLAIVLSDLGRSIKPIEKIVLYVGYDKKYPMKDFAECDQLRTHLRHLLPDTWIVCADEVKKVVR